MDLHNVKAGLVDASERLARMDATLLELLANIDRNGEAERLRLIKEFNILEDAIRDAARRRRFRVVESLSPKRDEILKRQYELEKARLVARAEVKRDYDLATAEMRRDKERLSGILADAAAMDQQREMQIRTHRKIPVMK
jgi:hypothetical protein